MVKIPSLDELKKMGTGMVDKVKTGIESISSKNEIIINDETVKNLFQEIYASLNEVTQAQAVQNKAIKKIETQIDQLVKIVESYQTPSTEAKEDKETHE